MPTDCAVNDLIKALHAPAHGRERRPTRHTGRLLVQCQQVCTTWGPTGCQLHDREEWIDILIRPGRDCERGCLLSLPPLGVVGGVAG